MSDDNSNVCSMCPFCKHKANKIKDIFLTFESPIDESNTLSFAVEQAVSNINGTISGYHWKLKMGIHTAPIMDNITTMIA
eukprot:917413-Ditylum_brightwellii.AAC.1